MAGHDRTGVRAHGVGRLGISEPWLHRAERQQRTHGSVREVRCSARTELRPVRALQRNPDHPAIRRTMRRRRNRGESVPRVQPQANFAVLRLPDTDRADGGCDERRPGTNEYGGWGHLRQVVWRDRPAHLEYGRLEPVRNRVPPPGRLAVLAERHSERRLDHGLGRACSARCGCRRRHGPQRGPNRNRRSPRRPPQHQRIARLHSERAPGVGQQRGHRKGRDSASGTLLHG